MIHEFHYRVSWRATTHRPGHHRGARSGAGFEFTGHASLLCGQDPRRLDVRASIADPFGDWKVRVFRQLATVPVWLVADLSASMGFHGHRRKLDVLADFTASLGYSAWRTGDPFGAVGCDSTVRRDLSIPLTRLRGAGPELATRLRALQPRGEDADGLLEAHRYLGRERSLVFLVSDFHFPLAHAARVLASFERHAVVPVVLWDPQEYRHLPRFGLVTLRDPETREARTLLLRPRLRERIGRQFAEHREALTALFTREGHPPLFLDHGFHPDRITAYFYEGARSDAHADVHAA
jgi:uncharacterized protein (DUF58 family)